MVCCFRSSSGIIMTDLEVHFSQPHTEAASVVIPVSSHCNYRTLVLWYEANSREFVDSILLRPHQRTDQEFRLKVSWCGEPLSSVNCKALVPNKCWLKSSTGNRWGLTPSNPVEAAPKKAAKSTRVVTNYSSTLTEVFRAFPQLQGICQVIIQKAYGLHTPMMETFSQIDSPQVAEAFSQIDVNHSEFSSQTSIEPKFLSAKDTFLDWIILLPSIIGPSLNISRPSAKTNSRYRKHNSGWSL
jgi:hypothetical protein